MKYLEGARQILLRIALGFCLIIGGFAVIVLAGYIVVFAPCLIICGAICWIVGDAALTFWTSSRMKF